MIIRTGRDIIDEGPQRWVRPHGAKPHAVSMVGPTEAAKQRERAQRYVEANRDAVNARKRATRA